MNIKRISTNAAFIASPAVIALAATLLVPVPAAAADHLAPVTGGCPGARVGTYPLNDSARIEIYYSAERGGTNCVKTLSDKTSTRYLHIWASVAGSGDTNSDEGLYRSYAGPVTFTGTAGHCLSVTAKASPGTDPAAHTRRAMSSLHCD